LEPQCFIEGRVVEDKNGNIYILIYEMDFLHLELFGF